MEVLERESFEALMARTNAILEADLGPRVCGACGAQRTVGRRAGDNGAFVCLAGCEQVGR